MDINALLTELRQLLGKDWHPDHDKSDAALLSELHEKFARAEELFQALDGWLTRGGFKPTEWHGAPSSTTIDVADLRAKLFNAKEERDELRAKLVKVAHIASDETDTVRLLGDQVQRLTDALRSVRTLTHGGYTDSRNQPGEPLPPAAIAHNVARFALRED
jgi:hypothetical protein